MLCSQVYPADLVLIAIGYKGPEALVGQKLNEISEPTGNSIDFDQWGNYVSDYKGPNAYSTPVNKVFVAGDCRRGQSTVVWAISEGRSAARRIDRYLMGTTQLKSAF